MMKYCSFIIVLNLLSIVSSMGQHSGGCEPIDDNYTPDTNIVYTYVGVWPQFPGWHETSEFKTRDIRYYNSAKPTEEERKTMVIVGFTVEKNGTLTDPKILKSNAPEFDEDAIRIISNMPKWLPGKNNGVAVRCRYRVTIIYHPSQNNPSTK
ncbi:MAG: TonB family protein [Cytophagaceae bacterium]|jgi:protein TonB|nr:TonB family protein [Cytophagaceae bacterium]